MEEKLDRQAIEKRIEQKYALQIQQIRTMEKKMAELQEQNEALAEENKKLKTVTSSDSVRKIEHSNDFWSNIQNGCSKKTGPYGSDSIKTMIKTEKMTVHDSDHWKCTLLNIAAVEGAYDLAQFLINNVYKTVHTIIYM